MSFRRYLYDSCDLYDLCDELWLILLFNKIRFENKISIEMRGCFVNLENFAGKRGIRQNR